MTTQATQQHVVPAPGGRVLAVEEAGAPGGLAVLVHNGTPNSRHLYGPHVADATARGLRLISYDRPGDGGSSPQPRRAVGDCAADGGGPHLRATAALLPGLVVAAASLASPAPFIAEGLDWFAGMGQENVDDFKLASGDDFERIRARCEEQRTEALGAPAANLAATMPSLLTPTDAAVFTGELAEYLVWSEQDGFAPGAEGLLADSLALTREWTFELGDISVPMLLLHGREDKFVPFGHGQWLAEYIPGVEARLLDHDGHLTLAQNRIGEVHAWLAAHA